MNRVLQILVMCTIAAACSSQPANEDIEGDSPARRLEARPDFRIGLHDGAEEFQLFRVRGAVEIGGNHIHVLNAGTYEVRVYDADGAYIASNGRQGEGPGEFRFPVGILRADDTVSMVVDMSLRRLTFLDPTASVIGVRRSRANLSGFSGLLAQGSAVTAAPRTTRGLGEGIHGLPMIVRIVEMDNGREVVIGDFGDYKELNVFRGDIRVAVPLPFAVHPVVRVREDQIYVMDGSRGVITVFAASGESLDTIEFRIPRRSLNRSDAEKYINWLVERLVAANRESGITAHEMRQLTQGLPMPDSMPLFDRMLADPKEGFWLRLFRIGDGDDQVWVHADTDGRITREGLAPSTANIVDISTTHALSIEIDSLGVEYVQRYIWSEAN